MKVKEVMKKYVVSVKPDDKAADVLGLLFKMQISGLPVIDINGKLLGMFTEKDVLSYILPATQKKFAQIGKLKVSQLMRKDVVTTTEDTTLCQAARLMLIRKARRLPVLDKTGRIAGIVARCDVLSALAREAKQGNLDKSANP